MSRIWIITAALPFMTHAISNRVRVHNNGEFVVVEVQGYELYDLLDDHFIEHLDEETVNEITSRQKEVSPGQLASIEIFLPLKLGVDRVLEVLSKVPPPEVTAAENADNHNAA